MPVALREDNDGRVLEVTLSGKLTRHDYEEFGPAVEVMLKDHAAIRILCLMDDFHGWTLGALWEDIKFDWKHFSEIERIAFVGDRRWEQGMATFCKPFTKARIRYFDVKETAEARAWIHADLPAPAEHV